MSERIHVLRLRNLLEVFGEGDSAKRRSAIEELYTDECVVYVPPGILFGHDALDKFACDLRATHPHFAYAPHASPQALHKCWLPNMGLRSSRRGACLYGIGRDHRPR
jgi:hypothetical protein